MLRAALRSTHDRYGSRARTLIQTASDFDVRRGIGIGAIGTRHMDVVGLGWGWTARKNSRRPLRVSDGGSQMSLRLGFPN